MIQPHEIVVDGFAGGGGASEGIRRALASIGRHVDIAIDHDPEAIAMHEANHPEARRYCESIFAVDPIEACAGRPVGLAWFSPDCTHFSRAKGGAPKSKEIRGLADVVLVWAEKVRPRIVIVENVEEFQTWGPLDAHGQPIKARAGEDFARWKSQLESLGYEIEIRSLVAADYGAPTTRKRLFIVARCDGQPIAWPAPTHGRGRARAHRTAADDVIDWSIPCPSIFGRKKSPAEKTLIRIAAGVRRYVLGPNPFIVPDQLVAGTMVHVGNGERKGQSPRIYDIRKPLGTVVAQGVKHHVVAAFLTKHFGGVVGHEVTRPVGAVTAKDHHALTTATLHRTNRSTEVADFLARYAPVEHGLFPANDIVMVDGEPHAITDIGSRMLKPRELFAAQGFGPDYVIDPRVDGKALGITAQNARAGNSVAPDIARALVEANVYQQAEAAE